MQDCLRLLLSALKITSSEITRQLLVAMVAAGSLFLFWPPYPLSFTLLPRLVCGDRPLLRAPSEDKSGCSLSSSRVISCSDGASLLVYQGLGSLPLAGQPDVSLLTQVLMAARSLIFRACYRLWLPGIVGPGPESEVNV